MKSALPYPLFLTVQWNLRNGAVEMKNPWEWGEKFKQIPSPTQMNLTNGEFDRNGVALFRRNLIPTQMNVYKRGFLAFLVRFFKEGFPSESHKSHTLPSVIPL